MLTYKRIAVEDYTISADNGDTLRLRRGEEYITSKERIPTDEDRTYVPASCNSCVTVYTSFWVPVPVTLFAGARHFTGELEGNWSA